MNKEGERWGGGGQVEVGRVSCVEARPTPAIARVADSVPLEDRPIEGRVCKPGPVPSSAIAWARRAGKEGS